MAILSPTIIAGDEQQDIETEVVAICGIELRDYLFDDRILTREIFEQYFEEILSYIEGRNYIAYQVLGYFILKTGSKLFPFLRDAIVESTKWEYDKRQKWPSNWVNLRKFYLNDLRKKILAHESGIKTNLINLRVLNDKEFGAMCIGLDHLYWIDLMSRNKVITHVNLDGQGLMEIPSMVFKFVNLKKLSIENNMIRTIPNEIVQLKELQELFLGYNNIEIFPESICHLNALEVLFVARNNLQKFPDSIGCLKSLKELYLQNNSIRILPDTFIELKGKCFVNLENNPLKNNPFAINWDNLMPDLGS